MDSKKSKDSLDVKKKPRGMNGGRKPNSPDVWTSEYIESVSKLLVDYVESVDHPSIAEFCYINKIHRQRLYDNVSLSEIRDWLLSKKISYLEKKGLSLTKDDGSRGTFIIFALKQLGWRDKTEVEHSGSVVNIIDDVR